MKHFKTSETTLYFNTRDELVKVKLDHVAYIEADSNYCHVVFINGVRVTLLTSLLNIEKLINECFKDEVPTFLRIGKSHIVNLRFILQINIPRQRLLLSDLQLPQPLEIAVSREALKALKQLYVGDSTKEG